MTRVGRLGTIRVAHQRSCENANRTALDSLDGCTCAPRYYTFYRDSSGRPIKGTRTPSYAAAQHALQKLRRHLSEEVLVPPPQTALERKPPSGPSAVEAAAQERLLSVAELAAFLDVGADWVYLHADELGAWRLGNGPKARLRFDLDEVRARLTAAQPAEEPMPKGKHRKAPRNATVDLLPIRGRII